MCVLPNSKILQTDTDPLILYEHYIGQVDTKLNFDQITMHQLVRTIQTMSPTSSSAADFISICIIKDAGPAIFPHLLHLINQIIRSEKLPTSLKLTKVVPIRKLAKPANYSTGWRPINIVQSLSEKN